MSRVKRLKTKRCEITFFLVFSRLCFWLNVSHQLMTAAVCESQSAAIAHFLESVYSLSLPDDLKLFLSCVSNILSVHEGVSSGSDIISVWL